MSETSSEQATLDHKRQVAHYINIIIKELVDRAEHHDDSKLESDELPLFNEYTSKLKATKYDSPEYREFLKNLKPALDHHYAVNRHHPEHFPEGQYKKPCVAGMTLVDVVEMLCDWKAATLRQRDGNILKSIEINRYDPKTNPEGRFEYSEELQAIFQNTVQLFEGK